MCPYCNGGSWFGTTTPSICGPNCLGNPQRVTIQPTIPNPWPWPNTAGGAIPTPYGGTFTNTWPPHLTPLSDTDIQRIALAVVEMLFKSLDFETTERLAVRLMEQAEALRAQQ